MLQGVVVVVVGVDEEACERVAVPLRAARALVSFALLGVDALAVLSRSGFDAVVVDIGDECGRFVPLAASLREDGRFRRTLVVGLVSGAVDPGALEALDLEHVANDRDALPALLESLLGQRDRDRASERDHLEQQLRQALLRTAALRDDAQSLAHDARALCGIVLGFAANLRDEVVGPLAEPQTRHVAQIIEAATDMAAMLDRFGGAVRSDSPPRVESAPPPELERTARRTLVDLSAIAVATGKAFAQMVERHRLTLEVDAPTPLRIWGDPLQIKQVAVNLLSNAIKFTPPGGRVTASVRLIEPGTTRLGVAARSYAEFAISDTGPGIPPEDRERVFGRGVRLARDESVEGSGIGLAVAQEITVSHGGEIRAKETAGGGATIVAKLPLDMRVRREPAVVLVEEADEARRVPIGLPHVNDRRGAGKVAGGS